MFDIGWSEMAVILLVALVVIGPKDLPRLARTMGQWAAKGRAMAREFQRSLEDMAREAELDDVKREIEKVSRTDIGKTIEKTIDPTGEIGKAFDPTAASRARSAKATGVKPAAPADAPAAPASAAATPAATSADSAAPAAPASPAANGSAKPEPAPVAPESKSAASESKPPQSRPPEANSPQSKPSEPKTPRARAKPKKPEPKPEAVSAEPR